MTHRYDVYGIGNAIVDTEVQVEDLLLSSHGLDKGVMTLVPAEDQEALLLGLAGYDRHGAAGGSAANTMVGVAQFGGTAFFTGKIGDDMSGALYRESMAEAGVEFDVNADGAAPTGTCLVLVTPDGERTMQTALGASAGLQPGDVDQSRIAESSVLYVEGYLFGSETGGAAAVKAMEAAKTAGTRIAISLSDPAMAEFFRDTFRKITQEFADIVFCNEHEAAIYTGASSRHASLMALGEHAAQVFMTCGGDGSMLFDNGQDHAVLGHTVPVVDTTGAGDVYAAGVLYGITHGYPVGQAAKLGTFASARVITQLGPRLTHPLREAVSAILNGAGPGDWEP